DARECSGRIDQADDRQPKLGGQVHALERLAIALGVGTTVQALVALCQRVSLLLTKKHDAKVTQAGKASSDRPVVAEGPVAMQFADLLEGQVEVVKGLWPLRMPGHLDGLPGRQVTVDLPLEVDQLAADATHFLDAADRLARPGLEARKEFLHLVNLLLEGETRQRWHGNRLQQQIGRPSQSTKQCSSPGGRRPEHPALTPSARTPRRASCRAWPSAPRGSRAVGPLSSWPGGGESIRQIPPSRRD